MHPLSQKTILLTIVRLAKLATLALAIMASAAAFWTDQASAVVQTSNKIAFARGANVFVIKPSGSGLRKLSTHGAYVDGTLAWSPRKTRLAWWEFSDGRWSLFTIKPNGTGLKRAYSSTVGNYFFEPPAWVGERRLTFDKHSGEFGSINQPKDYGVYRVRFDGAGLKRLRGGLKSGFLQHPVASPDLRQIAFYAYQWEECGALARIATSADNLKITDRLLVGPAAWSPNSRRVAYVSTTGDYDRGPLELFEFGRGLVKKISAPAYPIYGSHILEWAPSTRIIFGAGNSVYQVTPRTGTVTKLWRLDDTVGVDGEKRQVSWAPDATRFVVEVNKYPNPSEIWVARSDGSRPRRLQVDATDPLWH